VVVRGPWTTSIVGPDQPRQGPRLRGTHATTRAPDPIQLAYDAFHLSLLRNGALLELRAASGAELGPLR
jgi:hypothetical protein